MMTKFGSSQGMITPQTLIRSKHLFLIMMFRMVIIQMICLTDPNTQKGNRIHTPKINSEIEEIMQTNRAKKTSGISTEKMIC